MKTPTRDVGSRAEQIACQYLREQGLRILRQNYHCRSGEIDIIARDKEHLVFVEVRYRKSSRHGSALDSITASKRRRLIQAARHYLHRYRIDQPCRFDVIGLEADHRPCWIKDAFQT